MPGMGGPPPRPPPKPFPQPEMEAWIKADVATIHAASRESGISEDRDETRAQLAGSLGVVSIVVWLTARFDPTRPCALALSIALRLLARVCV